MANPAETAYFRFRDHELSNNVWIVQYRRKKLQFTPFGGGPKLGCYNSVGAGIIKNHNIFVLCSTLVKFHNQTRLIGSFPSTYRSWSCAEEKLHFTSVHTLRQLKRDKRLFPPLLISLADRNGLKNLPRQISGACVKFGGNPCRDVQTLAFYTHTYTNCIIY